MKGPTIKIVFVEDILRKIRDYGAFREFFHILLEFDIFMLIKARQSAQYRGTCNDDGSPPSPAQFMQPVYTVNAGPVYAP